jgi:hypothetical protein
VSGSFRRSAEVTDAAFCDATDLPEGLTPGQIRLLRQYCDTVTEDSENGSD